MTYIYGIVGMWKLWKPYDVIIQNIDKHTFIVCYAAVHYFISNCEIELLCVYIYVSVCGVAL